MTGNTTITRYLAAPCLGFVTLSAVTFPLTLHAEADSAPNLEEIVVTAQKRDERAVDVPISITAISGDSLEQSGIRSTVDLARVVPGLRIDMDGSFVQPTLRGIGNSIAGPGVNPAVASYIDGYYQPSQLSTGFDLVGIQSIQVLKGPQGTLFGRNATGGAISVTTRNPSFTPGVEGTASYGRYNDMRTTIYATGPLTDNLAANLAVLYNERDGFVRNDFLNQDAASGKKYTARAKLLWNISDDFSAVLTAERFFNRDDASIAYNTYQGLNLTPFYVSDPTTVLETRRGHTYSDAIGRFEVKGYGTTLTLTKELGDFAKVTSYSQLRDEDAIENFDADGTTYRMYQNSFYPSQKTITQEVDIASLGAGEFQWAAGFYYYRDKASIMPFLQRGLFVNPLDTAAFTKRYDNRVKTTSYAGFADGTYEVLPNLFLTAGLRYTTEELAAFSEFPPAPSKNADKSFNSLTPRGVIRYSFSDDTNVYVSYSKGFKSGGFTPSDNTGPGNPIPPFDPEKVNAYELGFKTRQGQFTLEGATFLSEYSDQQVAYYEPGAAHTFNAASSEIYGAELQGNANVTDNFTLGVGLAYQHGRYKDFANASAVLATGAVTVDASGLRVQRSPDFTGNVTANYSHPVGQGRLDTNATYYYTSEYPFEPSNTYVQEGYGLLSARMTYTFAEDRFHVAVYGNNLTDEKYVASILPFPGLAILQQYAMPITYGMEFGFDF